MMCNTGVLGLKGLILVHLSLRMHMHASEGSPLAGHVAELNQLLMVPLHDPVPFTAGA